MRSRTTSIPAPDSLSIPFFLKISLFAITALGLLMAAGPAPAQEDAASDDASAHECPTHRKWKHTLGDERSTMSRVVEHHAERLGLDEATLEQVRTIAQSARAEAEPVHEQLVAAHEQMRALMQSEPVDRDAVLAQTEVISDLKAELRRIRVETRLDIIGLLSPEQRERLAAIHAERKERRQEIRERIDDFRETHADEIDAFKEAHGERIDVFRARYEEQQANGGS